ncbi:MAG: ribonuclease H-like domain-containing protein [Acidobacteria bacterium]|nr:ribonuclease H-like domain-containing protein [Acidobacteriota bacterium]
MSTLTERLRGIVGGVGGAVPRVAPEVSSANSEASVDDGTSSATHTAARISRGLDAAQLSRAASILGGEVTTTTTGATIVVQRHYAAHDRHGRVPVREITETLLAGADAHAVLTTRSDVSTRLRAARYGEAPPRHDSLWFLDLETTGLAGGAGTQAFLVGCACLDADGITVTQFLMPGYEHERTLLAEVAAWAAARGTIVTFNGKSFDVPLIETRYLLHRVPFPFEDAAHTDMLHPARRLWRARGTLDGSADASCSLGTLERLLAGLHRVGDVPGFEIPSRYFQFVRDGDANPLEAVLEHNRLDLVSLALVMARAFELIQRGPASTRDAYECLGLGCIYDRAGDIDAAEAAYVRASEALTRVGRDPETLGDALRRLAYVRRRAGRVQEAVATWQRLADLPRCPAALRQEAREALAIFHEHKARDFETAHAHARQLLVESEWGKRREAVEHRLRRLERKLQRRAALWES